MPSSFHPNAKQMLTPNAPENHPNMTKNIITVKERMIRLSILPENQLFKIKIKIWLTILKLDNNPNS